MFRLQYILRIFRYKLLSRKFFFYVFFVGFSFWLFLNPLKQISNITGYGISPWGYPLLLSNVFFAVLFLGSAVYVFSDIPDCGKESMFHYIRLGRIKWGIVQLITIVFLALIITLLSFLVSVVTLLPNIVWEKNWGRIYYTIALTDASSQYELLFLSPYKILSHYKAIEALLMTIGMVFLVLTFLGVAMFSISIFFSNSIAIIFGEIFAISPLVVDNISQKTPIVQFFSPASWIGISNIGYEYNWDCPTMGYIIFVLCVLIGIFSVMSLLKIKKKGIY